MLIVVSVVGDGEANTCRTFNIQHTSVHVPGERVGLDECLAVVEDEGAEFSEEAFHRGAPRAAIEPQEERISSGIVQRLYQNIV